VQPEYILNFRAQTVTAFDKRFNKPTLNNVQMNGLHYSVLCSIH